jgi:hypothetical protein
MTANMTRKRIPTAKTFLMAPNEAKKASTTYFKAGTLLMALKGLSALNALIALKACRFDDLAEMLNITMISKAKSISEVTTIMKSSLFHPDEKYGWIWNS